MNCLLKITLNFVLILVVSFNPVHSFAQDAEIKIVDSRVLALQYYLQYYDSPLSKHAELLVQKADQLEMDWKLLPAIAAVESNFGHKIPGGKDPDYRSFNAWGWGVYGSKVTKFPNWERSITVVSEGVKHKFIDLGMTDPYKMNTKYSSNPDWGWQVVYFIDEIEQYEKAFNQKFGAQINAYNQKLIDLAEAKADAQKYLMPKTNLGVREHRLTLL